MFDYLYDWLRDISYYLILVTAVTYVLPSNSYRKYIRFFTGLVLIMMLVTPVLDLFRVDALDDDNLLEKYISEYEEKIRDFTYVKEDFLENKAVQNEMSQGEISQIEVEDIVIGP